MRYESLPWPEDVPRRTLPAPFWSEFIKAMMLGKYIAEEIHKKGND